MRTSAVVSVAALLLAPHSVTAGSPDPATRARPAIRVFTDEDGLPQSSVEATAVDGRGFLWVCTRDGAASYDGTAWHALDLPVGGSNWPRTVLATADGALWFGSETGGVHRLADGSWQSWDAAAGLPSAQILSLAEVDGATGPEVWAGTGGGVARLRGKRWEVVPGVPVRTVRALAVTRDEDASAEVWAGVQDVGLMRVRGAEVTLMAGAGAPRATVQAVLPSHREAHTLWVAAGDQVLRLDRATGRWRRFAGADHAVLALAEVRRADGESELWLGTEGGGVRTCTMSGACRPLATRPEMPSPFVFALRAVPADGPTRTVWMGTLSGLARLHLGGWRSLDAASGLPDAAVVSLLETTGDDGTVLWLGTAGGGLARVGKDVEVLDQGAGLPDDSVFALAATADGAGGTTVWAGTGGGLARREHGRWRTPAAARGLPDAAVVSLLAERDAAGAAALWIGTYGGGLARLAGGALRVIDERRGLPDGRVEALEETTDKDGASVLWVATDRGLVRLEGDRWDVLDRSDGLPDDVVRSLHVSAGPGGGRVLWVGTGGGVAWRALDGGGPFRVLSEHTTPALSNHVVYRIEEDRRGRLYLGTNGGVIRLTRRPGGAGPPQPGDLETYTFTTADGLPSNECSFGASLVDGEGRIWMGTVRGAAVFDPRLEVPPTGPPPLRLTAVTSGATVLGRTARDEPLELPYDRTDLQFAFTLVSDFREGDSRYRSQLVGFDDEPSPWLPDVKRSYTNLPAGSYSFEVWGRDAGGAVAGPVRFRFHIATAPWRTWWAWLLYALVAAVAVTGGVRLRVAALRRRADELGRKVEERTQELAHMVLELRESERRTSEAHAKLRAAQERIEELRREAPAPVDDVDRWAQHLASELAGAVDVPEVDLWVLRDDRLAPLTGSGAGPPLELAASAARQQRLAEWGGTALVPVTGMSGDLVGAMTLPRRAAAWDEAEQRLLTSFASHLGASIELHQTRQDLASAQERLAAMRQDLIDKGIDILFLCPRCGACFDQNTATCPEDGTELRAERAIPFVIGERYRLRRVLGRGAMGAVFVAWDEQLARSVAVKVLNPTYDRSDGLRRLEREIRLITRLEHPGVVAVHDTGGLPDGSRFLVMEHLRGADLARVLAEQGVGLPEQVAALARQGGDALGAAHHAGLIHRDIKPHNLFLHRAGDDFQVKILDFGIAKEMRGGTDVTATGLVPGTPAYMSPEQIQGGAMDARSDLYSFATVIYETLTGRPVVRPGKLGDVFVEVVYVDPPRVSVLRPRIPAGVDELLVAALAKDPAQRPHSVARWGEQLAARLEAVIDTGVRGWHLDQLDAASRPVPLRLDSDAATDTAMPATPAEGRVGAEPRSEERKEKP